MTSELIPPFDLDHALPADLPREELARLWLDVLEASDQMLLAGIKATLPTGGDVREAYRTWYEQYGRDHLEMLERMAERFNRTQAVHVSPGNSQNA